MSGRLPTRACRRTAGGLSWAGPCRGTASTTGTALGQLLVGAAHPRHSRAWHGKDRGMRQHSVHRLEKHHWLEKHPICMSRREFKRGAPCRVAVGYGHRMLACLLAYMGGGHVPLPACLLCLPASLPARHLFRSQVPMVKGPCMHAEGPINISPSTGQDTRRCPGGPSSLGGYLDAMGWATLHVTRYSASDGSENHEKTMASWACVRASG